MKKPIINRYDITISPNSNALVQKVIEVDAVDMETACDYVRFVFRNSIYVVAITAHRERKTSKVNPVVAMFERIKCTKLCR
jgi:hypothetical protein